jgi:hypothetical protein
VYDDSLKASIKMHDDSLDAAVKINKQDNKVKIKTKKKNGYNMFFLGLVMGIALTLFMRYVASQVFRK